MHKIPFYRSQYCIVHLNHNTAISLPLPLTWIDFKSYASLVAATGTPNSHQATAGGGVYKSIVRWSSPLIDVD